MALVKCADCGKEISDQAPACPHCGRPTAGPPRPAPPTPPPARNSAPGCGKAAVIVILVFLGLLVVLAVALSLSAPRRPVTAAQSAPSPSYAGIGREGRLYTGTSGPSVPVPVSREALGEMVSAGSDRVIAALVVGGGAFLVDRGTRVAVVDSAGPGGRKIRILEGPMVGRVGFVPEEWCRE